MSAEYFPLEKIESVYVLLREEGALDAIPDILWRNYTIGIVIMNLFGL